METQTQPFVPAEALQALLVGSTEHVSSLLVTALQGKVFGEGVAVHVLGTYPNTAIVSSPDGKFAKVGFEMKHGAPVLKGTEALDVPIYTKENFHKFELAEAKKIVELFMEGRTAEAKAKLAALIPVVEGKLPPPEKEITESIIAAMQGERAWKRLYTERSSQIRRFLWGDLTGLEENRLQPKFKKLYDGSMPEDQIESYKDVVSDSMTKLRGRVVKLADAVEAAASGLNKDTPAFRDLGEDAVIETFGSFSEDLVADLRSVLSVLTAVQEDASDIRSSANIGELHDAVAESLYDYEVAGRFVERMIAKLQAR